jgi:hypothetical protein
MKSREELVTYLQELRKSQDLIQAEIAKIDYEDRLAAVKKYEGKCYKRIENDEEYVDCVFVYDTDEVNCETRTLRVAFKKGGEESFKHGNIDFYSQFDPEKWKEIDEWEEITHEEFLQAYRAFFDRLRYVEYILDKQ